MLVMFNQFPIAASPIPSCVQVTVGGGIPDASQYTATLSFSVATVLLISLTDAGTNNKKESTVEGVTDRYI